MPDFETLLSPGAPIIYFDGAPGLRENGGVFGITLCAAITAPDGINGEVKGYLAIVAHLRGNKNALISLRNAIDSALLAGAKTEGDAN